MEWLGKGTKDEPFIINSLKGLSNQIWIKKSEVFIYLKNCNFNYIWLIKAQNITIENCTGDIYLHHCNNIEIKDNNIPTFKLNYSFNNKISNCSIDYVGNHFSRGNQFINNKIPLQFIRGIVKGTYKKLYTSMYILLPIVLFLVLAYLLTSDFVRESPPLMYSLVFGIIMLGIVEFSIFLSHYRNIHKLKKYPLNLI